MLRLLYRNLGHHITTNKITVVHLNDVLVGVLHQNQNPLLRFISNIPESINQPSFTVDYLVNKCGLPPKTALSAANKFHLSSTENADSVISLFQSYGLTKTQIAELISKRPNLLLLNPDKILKPKIDFLYDLGIPGPNIAKIIVSDSALLTRSLENQMIPSMNFLKSYIHTESEIWAVVKRATSVLQKNLDKVMGPNIATLRDYDVPDRNISKLLIFHPRTLMLNNDRFKKIVQRAKNIGFEPSSTLFFHAVRTMGSVSKLSWEKKVAVYRELGWSEDDILSAFKKQPCCMMVSEEKLRKGLEFYMKKLKLQTAEIVLSPVLLLLSLEKRVIPRCVVLEVLTSKGMKVNKSNVRTILKMSERDFLEKFVTEFKEEVPEVMKAYKGEIEFGGFGEFVNLTTEAITNFE